VSEVETHASFTLQPRIKDEVSLNDAAAKAGMENGRQVQIGHSFFFGNAKSLMTSPFGFSLMVFSFPSFSTRTV